jgi:hypothetical protein
MIGLCEFVSVINFRQPGADTLVTIFSDICQWLFFQKPMLWSNFCNNWQQFEQKNANFFAEFFAVILPVMFTVNFRQNENLWKKSQGGTELKKRDSKNSADCAPPCCLPSSIRLSSELAQSSQKTFWVNRLQANESVWSIFSLFSLFTHFFPECVIRADQSWSSRFPFHGCPNSRSDGQGEEKVHRVRSTDF